MSVLQLPAVRRADPKGKAAGGVQEMGNGTRAPISDVELIKRAQHGDEAAFYALFQLHKRRVYSLCLRMTRNAADAEDLTQEAFMKAFRKIGTFRSESAFSTWLHRVAANEVLMHFRKKRFHQVPLEEGELPEENVPPPRLGRDDLRLVGTVDRVDVNEAVAMLAPGLQTAFTLFDVEGYGHREIAEKTDRSIGCSKSQLHKARRKLRDLLGSRNGPAGREGFAKMSSDSDR